MSEQAMREFRERVDNNDLSGTKISYRIVGGMRNEPGLPPLPPADEVLTIEGDGTARLQSGSLMVGEARLNAKDIASLFERVGANLPGLVPRSEASFIPDSVIGEITIDVAGERQQLYFVIDDDAREQQLAGGLGDMRSTLRGVVDEVLPTAQKGVRSWP